MSIKAFFTRVRSTLSAATFALALAAGAANCGGLDEAEEVSRVTEAVTAIDPALAPATPTLPGTDEILAAVVDENGTRTDFVEDEVIIATDDSAALAKFLARYGGSEVDSVKPQLPSKPEQVVSPATVHLVRIDPLLADTSTVEANIRTVLKLPAAKPQLTVSSKRGLGAIAAALDGIVSYGLVSGLRLTVTGSGFRQHTTADPLSASSPGGYSPDAYTWGYMSISNLGIGVSEAWTALSWANRVIGRTGVTFAAIDQGFAPTSDFPSVLTALSAIPGRPALNAPNLGNCGPGNPCPWHGSGVVQTALGVGNNGFGGAGPAGVISNGMVVSTSIDAYSNIAGITLAVANGARLVNMSWGGTVGWALAWSVAPFAATTGMYRRTGVLFFASAGNDGRDIDAQCPLVGRCVFTYPCQNDGVICVGAINSSAPSALASYSAWGSRGSVSIFGSGTVFTGPVGPGSPTATTFSGTSAASPFVAGIATLLWSSRPNLTADDVTARLLIAARPSADPRVTRVVNAYDAVLEALGTGANTVNSCAHPLCSIGGPLAVGCDAASYGPIGGHATPANCVQTVVGRDPFCGAFGWDGLCVSEARSFCGITCL